MKRFCPLFIFLMMISQAAHGQSQNGEFQAPSSQSFESGAARESLQNESSFPKIAKITFSGLKRTKEHFLKNELSSYIGRPLEPKTKNAIESDLQALNLFSSIKFSEIPLSKNSRNSFESENSALLEESFDTELLISVTEKISFIPLPFAMYSSSSGFMAGAFVMDMNALGINDVFAAGLMWAMDDTMVLGMYRHAPSVGKPGFSVSASFEDESSRINDCQGEKLFEYDSTGFKTFGDLLIKLDRYNLINFGAGYAALFPDDADLFKDLYTRNRGVIDAGWNITDNSWNGVFLSTTSFNAVSYLSVDNKGRAVTTLLTSAKIQQPLTQKLRLNIDSGAGMVLNGLLIDGLRKSDGRVVILDDKFLTPKIAGASSGLEFAFLKTQKVGTFSVYADYEFFFAQDFDDSLLFCQGFSCGTKVYVSKLAFPALSIGLAYNATKSIFYFSGSFGVSF